MTSTCSPFAGGVRPQFIHSRARGPCLITVEPILLLEALENANVHVRSRTIRAIPEIELGGTMCELCRRSFLGGLATVGAARFMPKAFAPGASAARFERPNVTLPARGEFVITNATIITMDPQLGDVANGSVHVRNGAIVAVGANVSAPGAAVVDAQGRVVMPGLIDTHWHMWHTLFRGMSGDKREDGFFPTVTR